MYRVVILIRVLTQFDIESYATMKDLCHLDNYSIVWFYESLVGLSNQILQAMLVFCQSFDEKISKRLTNVYVLPLAYDSG